MIDIVFISLTSFNYLHRLLSYITKPKTIETPNPNAVAEGRDKDHVSRFSGARIQNSIVSIGDLFKDMSYGPGSKSVKFPDKLLKVLEQRLQNIAMAKDPAYVDFINRTKQITNTTVFSYSDQLLRRTMGKFYGEVTKDSFKKAMKERKVEELILMFVTQATGVLRKEPSLEGDGWKIELNNQVSQFVKLIRECLRTISHVSPDLMSRLDMYTAKLAPPPNPTPAASDSGYDTASTSRDRNPGSPVISGSVADMELVRVVAALFKVPESAVQKEVDNMRKFCTEKAALMDLKVGFSTQKSWACLTVLADMSQKYRCWSFVP